MEPIDTQQLATVTGGFGALLGALLQAAPGIMQGVGSIISASNGGGGGGGGGGGAPQQAAPQQAAPQQGGPPQGGAPAAPAFNPASLFSSLSGLMQTFIKIG